MIAKNKRVIYVDGKPYSIADMNLQEWLDPKSYGANEVYRLATEKLLDKLRKNRKWFNYLKKYGLDNFLTSFCWSIVNTNIGYEGDSANFKRVDWWATPTETWSWAVILKILGGLDCEDTTFLLSSSLELVKQLTKRNVYYSSLGYYYYRGTYYGHGYVLYFNSYLKKWCVLETTWDSEVSPFVWYLWNPNKYVLAVAFNRKEILRMDLKPHREKLNLTEKWYLKHEEAISAMIKYITLGEKLEVSWMHKKVRPVEVSLEDQVTMI